jgi:hypothetical protein
MYSEMCRGINSKRNTGGEQKCMCSPMCSRLAVEARGDKKFMYSEICRESPSRARGERRIEVYVSTCRGLISKRNRGEHKCKTLISKRITF